jgi:hypothetical protein
MWVTEREKNEAKQYDVYSYLRLAEPNELVRLSQNEYCLRSHDSFKISRRDGVWLWYWYSRDFGGRSAVDYLIKVKNYSFVDAVKEINRVMKGINPSFFIEKSSRNKEKDFKLPPKSDNSDIVINYLSERGIERELIKNLIDEGMIYQNQKYQSAVFVGFDDNGEPKHASYRSTKKDSCYKGDYAGSNKEYAFRIEKEYCKTVRVFESAIDLLSFIAICNMIGYNCSEQSLISTAGISASRNNEIKLPLALSKYLEKHPETENVLLCFDNDMAGKKCANQIKQKLSCCYTVRFLPPKQGKDYNEYLQLIKIFERDTL